MSENEKKYLGPNGLLYIWQKIKTLLAGKVDSVEGKGLSTNDYTTDEKNKLKGLSNYTHPTNSGNKHIPSGGASGQILRWASDGTAEWGNDNDTTYKDATTDTSGLMSSKDKVKLDGIASGAQVNVLESVKVNGTAQTVSSKSVNITVPTNNNQLTNGAGFQTASQVNTLIANALKGITGIDFQVVTALPETGVKGTIYLMASAKTETNNIYDEYIYINSKWEKMGTTQIDLSNYLKTTDLIEVTNAEIDTIFES